MAQACGEELVEEEREHALAAEVELLAQGRDHRLGPVAGEGAAVAVREVDPVEAGESRVDCSIPVEQARVGPVAALERLARALLAARAPSAIALIVAPRSTVEVDEPRDVVRGGLRPRRLVPVGWWRAVQAYGAARRRERGGDDAELCRRHPFARARSRGGPVEGANAE